MYLKSCSWSLQGRKLCIRICIVLKLCIRICIVLNAKEECWSLQEKGVFLQINKPPLGPGAYKYRCVPEIWVLEFTSVVVYLKSCSWSSQGRKLCIRICIVLEFCIRICIVLNAKEECWSLQEKGVFLQINKPPLGPGAYKYRCVPKLRVLEFTSVVVYLKSGSWSLQDRSLRNVSHRNQRRSKGKAKETQRNIKGKGKEKQRKGNMKRR